MNALAQNTVSRGLTAAKKAIEELKPVLDELNILYDSQGGLKETMTQGDLDSVASFSALTKQQLDDGMYALTATLKGAIDNAYTALAQLACRA